MSEVLDFPLPPTTGPYVAAPPTSSPALTPVPAPPPPAAPELDELTVLREKVLELDQVVSLAKTRVETLGAEKREALERALQLEQQLEAAGQREAELLDRLASHEAPRTDEKTVVAELLDRVAALEALVSPSRAA